MEDNFGKLVSKKEIAELLDVSERTIQRLSSRKQIVTIYQKKFHGGKIAYFPLSEVERIKLAWEKKEDLPSLEIPSIEANQDLQQESTPQQELEEVEPIDDRKSIAKTKPIDLSKVTKQETSAVEAAAKLILTVQEVSILTHIPEKELREDLKTGKLRGLFKGHGWKIKRAHLEDYVRSIYVPKVTDQIEDSGTHEIDMGNFGDIEPWEG